ncbi:MAG: hypothetical protein DRH17_13165 [Deltaproteobacteria bacterium]|nr:MAG: hypothetical protein DRH17_13165 [Deltaproteobacteria bacterium]
MSERAKVRTVTRIYKFYDPDNEVANLLRKGESLDKIISKYRTRLLEQKEVHGNVFLIEGVNFMWNCIKNGSCSPPFDEANSHIGVGDGTDPEDPSQTGLTGTNKYYKKVDTGYPVVSDNKITFRATFGADEANFTWNEWTVANGAGDEYTNLNRKVESLGTKSQGSTWVIEVELSIS